MLYFVLLFSINTCLAEANNSEFHVPVKLTDLSTNISCDITRCIGHCDRCAYVKQSCPSDGLIDYMSIYYCHNKVVGACLMIFVLIYSLCLLATTANKHFVPILETLSRILQLKEDVAGVTLIALGNGAPDVFTSLCAMQNSACDFSLMMGELLGGAMFVVCLVVATIILSTNEVIVLRDAFLRDVLILFLCVVSSFLVSRDGVISFAEVIIFLAIYLLYVFWVVFGGRRRRSRRTFLDAETNYRTNFFDTAGYGESDIIDDVPPNYIGMSFEDQCNEKRWVKLSVAKMIFILEYPVSILRCITIGGGTGGWSKPYRILSSISWPFGLLLILLDVGKWKAFTKWSVVKKRIEDRSFIFNASEIPLWLIMLVVGSLTGVLWYCTTNNEQRPRFYLIFVVYSFAVTVAWLDLLANEVVHVAESLGQIAGISTTLLGLTVLAWGNSIGDLVANTAVAKRGKVQAAVSACLGAPLFSTVFGICVALGWYTANNGHLVVSLNTNMYLGWIFLLVVLPGIALGFYANRISDGVYRGSKLLAYALIGVYVCYMFINMLSHYCFYKLT